MRALSLTQPWASLVVEGFKQYETRSWGTKYRGPLAIAASKLYPGWAKSWALTDFGVQEVWGTDRSRLLLPKGAVIGTVDLVDVMWADDALENRNISAREQGFGDWGLRRIVWQLANPVLFDEPIPVTGALGLWEWKG